MHSFYIINLAIIISYDRLYGDYESLINGYAADALVDFTGGVPESLDLTKMDLSSVEVRDNLFGDILDASENRALIMCHILVSLQLSFLHIEWHFRNTAETGFTNQYPHSPSSGGIFKCYIKLNFFHEKKLTVLQYVYESIMKAFNSRSNLSIKGLVFQSRHCGEGGKVKTVRLVWTDIKCRLSSSLLFSFLH